MNEAELVTVGDIQGNEAEIIDALKTSDKFSKGIGDQVDTCLMLGPVADATSRALILLTLAKLPKRQQRFVFHHCLFIVITDLEGVAIPPIPALYRRWHIILTFSRNRRTNVAERQSVIAHEIAHAVLNHRFTLPSRSERDNQAAHLAAQWGFTGKGANPEYFRRLYRNNPFL